MADNPADQETMRRSAAFFAEAIDIHSEHLRSEDRSAYLRQHADLDIELSAGSAQIKTQFYWLEKDLKLYSDIDEISAEDKQRLLSYTENLIDNALELSAARSEYAALGVLLKQGTKEGALQADQILNKGDLFANLDIPENLREWFRENILAPTLAKDFSDRKKLNQGMLEQVNSNIRTIERWNLAESDAHLSRYDAQVKFYKKEKDDSAVKEAEGRYNDLARKLERQTRELFKDQVLNGARSHGELKILYKLGDKPAIGKQLGAEITEPPLTVPETDLQSKPAPVRDDLQQATKPADTATSTADTGLTKGISGAPASGGETGTQTAEPKTGTTVTVDPKAGYETALQVLHKKGAELNPDYKAEAAEAALKKFVEYYLPFKSDEKIAPDDVEKLDGLILAAELYHRGGGDFEKMISPELLEDVLFTNSPPLTPPQNTGASGTETTAEQTGDGQKGYQPKAGRTDNKPNSPVVIEADLKIFADQARNLDYDALIQQMSEKAKAHDGKLPAMDILALLDEELNPEKGYDHKLAKDDMRQFLISSKMDPDQDVSLGDHNAIGKLARLALAYRLAKSDPAKVAALYAPGDGSEKATLDDSVSRFVNTLGKYHKKEEPEAGADKASAGADNEDGDGPSLAENSWYDPNADINWTRLGAIGLGAYALKKYMKSRKAKHAATTPDEKKTAEAKSGTKAKSETESKAGEKKTADADAEKTGKPVTEGADEQHTRTARAQAGAEPEEAARGNANGNNVRRGQAQEVIDDGLSPEMEAVLRENVELKERILKDREKSLDKLKFKHRTLEEEYKKSPQKNMQTEELLKAWEKDIERKQENIETLRRGIHDTKNTLEGSPRPRPQATPVSRSVEATTARAPVTESATRPVADVVPDNNNGTPVSERPVQTVRPAASNQPVTEPTTRTQSSAGVAPPDELIPRTVLEGDNTAAKAAQPAASTQAPGKPAPTVTPGQQVPPENTIKQLSPEFHEDVEKLKRHVGHLEEPFKPGAIETMLDERDIPRAPHPEVAMDAYNESSLRERAHALHTEERGLRAQKDELETKYREIEKREAKLRSKTNVFEEETREQRRERKNLEKLKRDYAKFEQEYEGRLTSHKADVESLAKDKEVHKQRGIDLDGQEAKFKAQESALNKEFADFEKDKHSLSRNEYERRWRELNEKRVDLHAKGMTLAEQRAYHQGMEFQSLSEAPPGAAKHAKMNTPPAGDGTVNVRGAFNQTNITRGLGVGGVGVGGYGLYKSIEAGDTAGITLNTGNILTGGAALWHTASAVVPKPVIFLATKLNIPMIFATGAYQIYSEKGDFIETNADGSLSLGDRGARTLAVTGTVLTGVATIVAGTAVAPAVILAGGAAIVGETAIEMRHSYRAHEEVNRLNKEAAQAKVTTGDNLERDKSGVPVVRNYSSLTVFAINYAKQTNVQDPYEHVNKTDYSDPKTLRKLEKALDKKIAELHKTIKDNNSIVPDWMRIVGTDSANKKAIAERELAPLEAARKELEIFKQDVTAHKKYNTQNSGLFTSWSRANEQLRDAAKGGFDAVILNGFNRDGDRTLSVEEIKAALVNSGIKSRAEIDTDHDDIISHKELEEALRRGLDGVKALAKDQFAEASMPEDNAPVGAGSGGPKVTPRK